MPKSLAGTSWGTVVVDAGFGTTVEGNGEERIDPAFEISCEFPSGEYYRRTR